MTTKVNVIDQAIPIIAQAVAEWQVKNSEEVLKKRVHDLLDKSSQEIVMKLLGFDSSWGEWRLDHCNGRSGNSPAGDYMKKVQQTAITEWLGTVPLPELSETLKKSILREAVQDFKCTVQNRMHTLVKEHAEASAQLLMNDLTNSKQITNYLAAMQLVSGEEDAS